MDSYPAKGEVVILDFETTGISSSSDRIIEVGAAIVEDYKIKRTFQSLCNPGYRIPSFITSLTGITNAMVQGQPVPEVVMEEFYAFIGHRPIIAHNASFDSRFLKSEMSRIGATIDNPILCTMLLSRRLLPDCGNHKLDTLREYICYRPEEGHKAHRALDDVKVTVSLWNFLQRRVEGVIGYSRPDFYLFQKISNISKYKVEAFLESERSCYESRLEMIPA